MSAPIITKTMAQIRQHGIRSAHRLNQRTHGWFGILVDATQKTLAPGSAITAAAIAYFALFSLFPLILLSISIASFNLGPLMDQEFIVQKLEFVAPALGQLLGQNIDEIIRHADRLPCCCSQFDLVCIYFFLHAYHTLNEIWGNKRYRSIWKRRGLSILFVLAFVGPALFLASLAGSMIANLRHLVTRSNYSDLGGSCLYWLFARCCFIYGALHSAPAWSSTWREILPGAIGAGLLWELAKKAFLFFVSTYISVSNLVYGSVAAIIAFLIWAYLSGLIFLFGAYLSVSYYREREPRLQQGQANYHRRTMPR